jgi:hypothetical protein
VGTGVLGLRVRVSAGEVKGGLTTALDEDDECRGLRPS